MAENLSIKKSPVECILECPLCLHQLKLPQTLQQCLHSYCKSCLDKVPHKTQDGRQGWFCPMCENFTKCDQVQQNTFIEELQKIQADPDVYEQIRCEQCSDDCSAATWTCSDCKIALCESAKITHLKIPMLKGHKVVPLDSDGEKFIDSIIFCNVHEDIPVQQNCCDCDQLICSACNTTEHKGHTAETVEEALERILPETESSARHVHENNGIIEAQIDRVKKEIQQTKESYASCRMQMDDHLVKVICRMKAMQAQMEEDVNEQESIALDALTKLKQQLESQLSQATIISNLTAVVTTKTRHASQLQQLQTGLFEKVKSAGEILRQSVSLKLPVTTFFASQKYQEVFDKVYGNLRFDMKEHFFCIFGESYTKPNHFLYSDLNKIAKIPFMRDKEIIVGKGWCNRLSYIDNKIWLPLDSSNEINIYDEDGELENVIKTGDKSITVVKTAHNGDLISAGHSGLFVTDTLFNKWTKLSEGSFSEICVDKDQFFALQYDCPSVHTYRLHTGTVNNGLESSWHESHSFLLNKAVQVTRNSIICIAGEQCLLISTTANKSLYKYSCGGECLDSCKDLHFYPMICGIDENGEVLVADFGNGVMYLLKSLSEKDIERNAILFDVQTPETRSVVVDQNNNLWVLTGNGDYKLIKYASQK